MGGVQGLSPVKGKIKNRQSNILGEKLKVRLQQRALFKVGVDRFIFGTYF
jgi:hypothetical protein